MFELLASVMLQIFIVTGQSSAIGNSGWGGGDVAAPTTTVSTSNAIGNSGWGGGDVVDPNAPTSGIGNSGWGGGD